MNEPTQTLFWCCGNHSHQKREERTERPAAAQKTSAYQSYDIAHRALFLPLPRPLDVTLVDSGSSSLTQPNPPPDAESCTTEAPLRSLAISFTAALQSQRDPT